MSADIAATVPEPYSAKYKDTFAFKTIARRLPVILTKAIDTTSRHIKSLVESGIVSSDDRQEAEQEMKDSIGRLAKLRNELETDKPFIELVSTAPDVHLWNQCLRDHNIEYGFDAKWFSSSWLYSECYFYRRIREAFEITRHVNAFDPFNDSKEEALKSSIKTVEVLAQYVKTLSARNDLNVELEFVRIIELSLWGNKCDLSLSCGQQTDQFVNPTQDLAKMRHFIIDNHIQELWQYVNGLRTAGTCLQLAIVLDNSGFELFTDLCLVEVLESIGLLSDKSVKFYVKSMPWFVSDVMTKDFHWLLNYLANDSNTHSPVVKELSAKWINNVKTGKWVIIDDQFWTLSHDYSQMKTIAPKLYHSLSEANLIIFKGDLNYRKLTADLMWDFSVPFSVSLRGFLPTPLCSLRTIKADVVVGVEDKQMLQKITTFADNWRETGDYAVIQLAQKL